MNWETLTLRQFIELNDIQGNNNLSKIEKELKMLCCIEQRDESEFLSMKYRDLLTLVHERTLFLNNPPEFKPVDEIEVRGVRFKFVHEVDKLTAGQFIDIDSFRGDMNNLHKAAAVFFLPYRGNKLLKYGEMNFNEVGEILLDAKFVEIQGCLLFFCELLTGFVANSEIFSKMTAAGKRTLIHSLRVGVGNIGQNKSPIMNELNFPEQLN